MAKFWPCMCALGADGVTVVMTLSRYDPMKMANGDCYRRRSCKQYLRTRKRLAGHGVRSGIFLHTRAPVWSTYPTLQSTQSVGVGDLT